MIYQTSEYQESLFIHKFGAEKWIILERGQNGIDCLLRY